MHKYKIKLGDGSEIEFESELFLADMLSDEINGTNIAFFEDAGIGINLDGIEDLNIDGQTYTVGYSS
ncbi:hypothetical protein [Solibacillus cecembensis]|uniref:hypothetical protein n=1 Tax=Solibacillus cecembensis TaxID=459347 RepID=UPI003D094C7F